MIAHKIFKVIVGIMLVVLLISTSVMSSFASSDIDLLDGYPYFFNMTIYQASDGSGVSGVRVLPYRDGNTFYFSVEPYIRALQFNFYFTKSPQIYRPGISVDSSLSPVSTSIPYDVSTDLLFPISIRNWSLKCTFTAERQVSENSYTPVAVSSIVSTSTRGSAVFYDNSNTEVYRDSFVQSNPFEYSYSTLSDGFVASYCAMLFRLFGSPSYDSPFAVRLSLTIDEFIVNGSVIEADQIITEANGEMESIFQRLSDYSLEHLTEVDLSDILNNVDNASNSVEDVRFLSIFDGIYGYGIIPTLITLSLCISFVGYLLFGKSG